MECRVWVAEGRVRVRVHHRVRADAGCGWMVHKGLLRCEGRRTERTQSTWRDPTVEAQRRKEKAFPPPTASSLPPPPLPPEEPPKRGAPGPPLPRGPPHTSLASCSHLCPPQQQQVRTFSSGLRPPPISISVNYVSYLPAASKSTAVPRSLRHPAAPRPVPRNTRPAPRLTSCLHFSFRITATTQPKQLR